MGEDFLGRGCQALQLRLNASRGSVRSAVRKMLKAMEKGFELLRREVQPPGDDRGIPLVLTSSHDDHGPVALCDDKPVVMVSGNEMFAWYHAPIVPHPLSSRGLWLCHLDNNPKRCPDPPVRPRWRGQINAS